MTANTKTPAMLLQEYTVKKKIGAPEYNLVVSKCGTHENEFHYKVNVAGVSALGIGRSKQVAKHSAALNALEMLNKMGVYDIGGAPPVFNSNLHRNEPDNPLEGSVNSIGCLQDLCAENKIPQPIFHEISDVGPPHARQFTYECEINSVKTQAIAKTKKQAKQLAAKLMLEKIKDIVPDLVRENGELDNALMEDDDAIKAYLKLSCFKVIPDKSAKLCDYPNCIKILIEKLNLTTNDFVELLKTQDEEGLKILLEKLELDYEIVTLQDSPQMIAMLDVRLDSPFSVLAAGQTEEEVKGKLVKAIFSALTAFIEAPDFE